MDRRPVIAALAALTLAGCDEPLPTESRGGAVGCSSLVFGRPGLPLSDEDRDAACDMWAEGGECSIRRDTIVCCSASHTCVLDLATGGYACVDAERPDGWRPDGNPCCT